MPCGPPWALLFAVDEGRQGAQQAIGFIGHSPSTFQDKGSNPKFCRSQRVFMSECFRFRSAYRSAAARAPAAEARRVALWNGEVIAQSNASLGKRRQDDWWTSGRLTMSTSAGRVRGVAGRRLSGSKTGRAPARAARRYTTFRKVVCICCLCPWLMHPMQ